MEGKTFKDMPAQPKTQRLSRVLPDLISDLQTGLQSHNGFLEWLLSPMGVASGLGLVLILAIGASAFFQDWLHPDNFALVKDRLNDMIERLHPDNFEFIKDRLYEMIELVYSKVFGT